MRVRITLSFIDDDTDAVTPVKSEDLEIPDGEYLRKVTVFRETMDSDLTRRIEKCASWSLEYLP